MGRCLWFFIFSLVVTVSFAGNNSYTTATLPGVECPDLGCVESQSIGYASGGTTPAQPCTWDVTDTYSVPLNSTTVQITVTVSCLYEGSVYAGSLLYWFYTPPCLSRENLIGSANSAVACYNSCQYGHSDLVFKPVDGVWIFGDWIPTGQVCGDQDPMTPDDGDGCTVDAGGNSMCIADDPNQSCGTVNGEHVCFDDLPDSGCSTTADGGTLCLSDWAEINPPLDINGDAMTPNVQISSGSGDQYNYYSGNNYSGGGSGGGGGSDPSGGDPTGGDPTSDPSTCDPAVQTCDDVPPYVPAGADDWYTPDDSKTFGSVLSAFSVRASNAPFIQSANSFFIVNISAGACPIWTMDTQIMGVIVIDMQCAPFMDSVWLAISAVLLAVAGFTAFRWAFL